MNRYISAILIPCLLYGFTSCTTSEYITKDKFLLAPERDYNVTTNDGNVYNLKENQYKVANDTIHFINGPIYFNPYKINSITLSEVKQYEIIESNTTGTIILLTAAIIVIGGYLLGTALKGIKFNF